VSTVEAAPTSSAFVRQSSGLVKTGTPFRAAGMVILNNGLGVFMAFFYLTNPGVFPRTNLVLAFVIAGILSDTTYGALSSLCGEGPCPASKASEASRGQTEQTVADVTLGIGLVALAAGATLFVLSMPPKAKDEHSPEPATPSASAELSIAPGWLGVRGSF